jgi:hypothetical protein
MSEAAHPLTTSNAPHPFVRSEALYDPWVQKQFRRHGIVIVPHSVPTEICEAVLCSIKSSKFIIVDEPRAREITRFYTINGDSLISACPEIAEIEHCLLEWISYISGSPYVPLDNRAVGVSLNVTPPGGGSATHHDSSAVTIILYLNDVDSGALHVYPAFPALFGRELLISLPTLKYRLRILRRYAIQWFNLSRGRVAKAVHQLLFHPIRVDPRAGTVAAFTRLSDHRVDPVAPGSLRFSLVFAADLPGVSFKGRQKYYGYGTPEVLFGDIS